MVVPAVALSMASWMWMKSPSPSSSTVRTSDFKSDEGVTVFAIPDGINSNPMMMQMMRDSFFVRFIFMLVMLLLLVLTWTGRQFC